MLSIDPISATIQAVGLGLQIFGGMKQSSIAHEQAGVSMDVASHEQQINSLKQQQTEMEAKRMQLQNIRNNQKARAMATASATNQGAQFGSGLQGGLADIDSQSLFNMQGVNQALWTSGQIFGQNNSISNDKMKMASLGADMSDAQGLSSLGGAMIKAGPTVGNIAGGFGNMFKSGNFSGTPGASNTGGLY